MRPLWQRLAWWLLGILAAFLLFWRGLVWWTDWLWYSEVGYRDAFLTTWSTRVGLFAAGLIVALLVLLGNFLYSRRIDRVPEWAEVRPGALTGGPVLWAALPVLLAVAALVFGSSMSQLWDHLLLMSHRVNAGVVDPVFGRDTAFYLTSLPFWFNLQKLLFGLFLVTWIALYLRYVELPIPGDPESFGDLRAISRQALGHLAWLGAIVFALWGWGCWLQRFQLLVTTRTHALYGVGFTDTHVRLPYLTLLAAVAALAAISMAINLRRRSLAQMGWTVGVYVLLLVGYVILPVLYQQFLVTPNEIERERPYIERTIAATREALGLAGAEVRQYTVAPALAEKDLAADRETIETVPLWSTTEISEQLVGTETLRGYYNFRLSDYDRYKVGDRREQVAVMARELQVERLDPKAQNWINRHLLFTHGFGLVMASAHDTGPAGEPVKLIRDIPPRTLADLPVTQPRIYFGEFDLEYVITDLREGTQTRELDYPEGEHNVFNVYDGRGGIPIGSLLRRLAFAVRFRDLNLLISRLPGQDSRLLFRRNILDRVNAIAPFLDYDFDPYPVLANGRVHWILDAYTIGTRYPYSWPYPMAPAVALASEQSELRTRYDAAYVRNSVKVMIDAYDGTISFHVYDPTDPLLQAYQQIYPGLFKSEPLPPEVNEHIRYPADLFALQSRAYSRFHMTDPDVFYNSEDLWDIAREETTRRIPQPDGTYVFESGRDRMTPYYVLLRLKGEERAQFRLILPFTPASSSEGGTERDNMIGWLAADCDPATYGKLTVYAFPKQTLVYGPMQVEALIDQDPEISQQMTLWSQQGSRVIRGNLLVIPLGDSLLYVEPIYITAERRGALPELKRVVVFYNGRIRMADTLDEALANALSGERGTGGAVEQLRLQRLATQAANAFAEADAARRQGDLRGYGEAMEKVKRAVAEMRGRRTSADEFTTPPEAPAPPPVP